MARCGGCGVAFTRDPGENYPAEYENYGLYAERRRDRGFRALLLDVFLRGRGPAWRRLLLRPAWLWFRAIDRVRVTSRRLYTRPFRRRGRLLDVGSGAGNTLAGWRDLHDHVVGVEPDPRAVRVAREGLGLDVRAGSLEAQAFAPASFDAATLCHVLEHLPDPAATLRAVAPLLRPGGELIVWVPDFGSLMRPLAGPHWFPYEAPRHLWHFRAAQVVRLLREAGFRPVEVAPDADGTSLRRSARAMGGWRGRLLRRRTVRRLVLLAARLLRRTDAVRIRAVKA